MSHAPWFRHKRRWWLLLPLLALIGAGWWWVSRPKELVLVRALPQVGSLWKITPYGFVEGKQQGVVSRALNGTIRWRLQFSGSRYHIKYSRRYLSPDGEVVALIYADWQEQMHVAVWSRGALQGQMLVPGVTKVGLYFNNVFIRCTVLNNGRVVLALKKYSPLQGGNKPSVRILATDGTRILSESYYRSTLKGANVDPLLLSSDGSALILYDYQTKSSSIPNLEYVDLTYTSGHITCTSRFSRSLSNEYNIGLTTQNSLLSKDGTLIDRQGRETALENPIISLFYDGIDLRSIVQYKINRGNLGSSSQLNLFDTQTHTSWTIPYHGHSFTSACSSNGRYVAIQHEGGLQPLHEIVRKLPVVNNIFLSSNNHYINLYERPGRLRAQLKIEAKHDLQLHFTSDGRYLIITGFHPSSGQDEHRIYRW